MANASAMTFTRITYLEAAMGIRRGIRMCAEWLAYCKSIGWRDDQLDDLERLWWQWRDLNGNLKPQNNARSR